MYIEIKDGSNRTYYIRGQIRQYGLSFKKTGKYTGKWAGNVSEDLIGEIEAFCNKNHVKLYKKEEGYARSSNYADAFFAGNTGFRGDGETYRCSYCGRIIRRSKGEVTVDHLIPVKGVANTSFWHKRVRQYMDRKGIRDINQIENLVPACSHCNLSKGSRMGFWIIRGYLGRNERFWKAAYLLMAVASVAILSVCIIMVLSRLQH
ncbi:MAG: HNH endonuclease [Holdemanella sp.]|nr:HNH endonuclease [Holdemanella sp.]